jgi:hypothetical protein
VAAGKVLSLWRARRLVETSFGAGLDDMGKFAANFVRANAVPDPALTDIARAKRMEGVTVNDTYEPAQLLLRKGQTIDRKALSALALLREKSLIGTLQTKLEQEKSVAFHLSPGLRWTIGGLAVLCVAFVVWRARRSPSTALVLAGSGPLLPGSGGRGLTDRSLDGSWRDRAIEAEGKAERAQAAIRSGVLGWMRERIFQTLARQRKELLTSQQRAEGEMRELEQRLQQLHTPLQERIRAYERRIEELEKDLAAKGEENRELIGARISVARQQLNVERERGQFGTN